MLTAELDLLISAARKITLTLLAPNKCFPSLPSANNIGVASLWSQKRQMLQLQLLLLLPMREEGRGSSEWKETGISRVGFAASEGSPAGAVWDGAEILPASRKVEGLS